MVGLFCEVGASLDVDLLTMRWRDQSGICRSPILTFPAFFHTNSYWTRAFLRVAFERARVHQLDRAHSSMR